MTGSLRALLERAIDYAGTFPPERLALDEAAHRFEDHRDSSHAWMLGRFVIQTVRVPELPALFAGAQPPKISAILPVSETAHRFFDELDRDLAGMEISGYLSQVQTLEGRLPLELGAANAARIEAFLQTVAGHVNRAGLHPAAMHWEAAGQNRTPLWQALGSYNRAAGEHGFPSGFKLRTGGLEASLVPTAGCVAEVIDACRSHGIPWKATAGLHESLPHRDEALGALLHGFINVFAAAALAHAQDLPRQQLVALLEDADPAHFQFTDEALTWRDLRVTTEEIVTARRLALQSFGSCSFAEPVASLAAQGWL